MTIYKPTWLCIKQHNQTGLKYFCKTTRPDPHRYNGSGKYWKLHLKAHGNDVTTTWCQLFTDRQLLVEYALNFSFTNNISDSSEWANLKPENGLDGGCVGTHRAASTRQKLSIAQAGKTLSEETRQKISAGNKGKHTGSPSEETRQKISAAQKGISRGPLKVEHKQKIGASNKGKLVGRELTETHKQNIAAALIGQPKSHKGKPWSAARRAAQKSVSPF